MKGFVDDGPDFEGVFAGGDFGDDSSGEVVEVYLGGDGEGEDGGAVFNDGGGGFIARGFEGEDAHFFYALVNFGGFRLAEKKQLKNLDRNISMG